MSLEHSVRRVFITLLMALNEGVALFISRPVGVNRGFVCPCRLW